MPVRRAFRPAEDPRALPRTGTVFKASPGKVELLLRETIGPVGTLNQVAKVKLSVLENIKDR